MYQENVVIAGGETTRWNAHENIVSLEETKVITQSSICADCDLYSVCSEADCLFVSGGQNRSTRTSVSKVQKFCSTTGKWINLPEMLEARDAHGSVCLNNNLYTIGGMYTETGSIKHRYSKISKLNILAWSYCKEMPEALSSPGVAVVSNEILVFGGFTAGGYSTVTLKYNPVTDTWTKCQPMPQSGNCYRRTATVGNKVFIGSSDMSFFLQYDVPSDQWMDITKPVNPTDNYALVSYQGCILALGGWDLDGYARDFVQSYDPSNEVWKLEKQTLPLPLYAHWAVVLSVKGNRCKTAL